MRYRVIALDLDGTLLTPEKTILPESIEALAKAQAAGAKVVIVTGRHHCAIHPFYQALALDTPAICCNGAYLYDYHAKKVLTADPLPVEQARQVIGLLDEHRIHGLLYADDAMIYQEPTGHVIRTQNWAQSLPAHQRPLFIRVPSLLEAAEKAQSIWKFALSHPDTHALQRFAGVVEHEMGLACEWSWHDQVDIAGAGNSKGKRLAQWVTSLGLTMADVIAFGDNYNDLSMLESAGLGIAMGNADEAIRQRVARSIGSNQQPGIAETLYQEVL
ncbi:pyridoxal phosphatase [Erwinia sp. OLTSP20]|uniref:pyridoxal phosphatase n=1 Tax=unclassified Erwinia TaxID=2622719 RepID=UPI000C19AF31|nr:MULTISPECIES: pyridoxal phosphatase [unclassified Erwinia]PIJ48852.1 pyridoxal phosphatase [Erwinia sp. OAMSP11]PIJ69473.1 pyridoxal phosphatase [Erwinia sp. OLSSP12]PIJ79307.1 pyridoxal phosphatase [Erwinia sp. OLCASP19]PIJ80833.1 pyridoxal phosphatase [Erwinia sp. OLMTSP26]PIJ82985.1 pyridoxal phosphatase [Erwinia sp. OLMDSP33]